MADVVGSDEGAEAAGEGVGNSQPVEQPADETGAEPANQDDGGESTAVPPATAVPPPTPAAPPTAVPPPTAAAAPVVPAVFAEPAAPAGGSELGSGSVSGLGASSDSGSDSGSGPSASAGSDSGFGFDRRKALVIGGAVVVVAGATAAALAATGGSGGSGRNTASGSGADSSTGSNGGAGSGGKASASTSSTPAVPAPTITTVPANGATGVDPSKPIVVRVAGGTIESVEMSGQNQTDGTLSTDGSSWTSANVLSVNSSYHLTITAKDSAGKASSSALSFRTLKPSATFGVDSVVPPRGSTVGVGQPIRVTFTNYVPDEYKAALERACVVTTSPPVAGAWYWVSNGSGGAVVDWRPESFWAVNTKVSIAFDLDGVRLGEHQFGVKDYAAHKFTISDRDLRLSVDKDTFRATCTENGEVIRTFPIDTGMTTAETFVTYTGTMAVLGKGNPVEMKGNYGPGDTYDDFVNWATQITWSGTYVHAAPWDGEIGHANDDSHGCIHCRTEDAEWYYGKVIAGDVVTVTGRRARAVAVDNGICTFSLDWATLLRGSAYGATLNGRPVSA